MQSTFTIYNGKGSIRNTSIILKNSMHESQIMMNEKILTLK